MKNKKIKRSILFMPVMLMALFVFNSFMLKHNEIVANDAKSLTVSVSAHSKRLLVNSILRSTNAGESWTDISKTPPKIDQSALERFKIKSEGVLIATSRNGIIRSTDNGEHWKTVISEDGGGITVSSIKGGFTAITFDKATRSNKIRISLDKGKTWQSIDKGLPTSISSITQMGEYLICGHMGGMFRSADMGKTWKRIRCGIIVHEEKVPVVPIFFQVYNPTIQPEYVLRLYVAGNTIYAVSEPGGC